MRSCLPAPDRTIPAWLCNSRSPGLPKWARLASCGDVIQARWTVRIGVKRAGGPSGGSLVLRAESGAEHLAQTVLPRGAEVQVMRDGWDHQAAIHAGTPYSLDRPKPVCHGPFEEWTVVVDWSAFLPDHGLSFHHLGCPQLDSGHIDLPETHVIKERAITSPNI